MSFGEEEGREEDVDKEEGGTSNEEFEESKEDLHDCGTLREILTKVVAPSSSSFRRLSSVAKGKQVVDPPTSSSTLLEILLDI